MFVQGATDDELKQLHTSDSPPKPAKCVVACMHENSGMASEKHSIT